MGKRGCEWPDGCARGAFHEVDTAPIGHRGTRALFLHHAGQVWNARKQGNRAAGRCTCGAEPSPGYRTCGTCRERARLKKRRQRALAARAAECGIVLPRQAGRRLAWWRAYCEAFNRSQRAARRRWFSNRTRGAGDEAVMVAVSVPWEGEGRAVTVAATCGWRAPGDTTCPIRGVPDAAPVDSAALR